MTIAKVVNCPTFGKRVEWKNGNKFRPFCCERCKLIDFGEWATEKHVIEGESVVQHSDDDGEGVQ